LIKPDNVQRFDIAKQIMQDMLVYSSNAMQSLLDAIVTSRFDLIMLGVGLMTYIILFSSRNAHAAKKFHKKVDICEDTEDSQVIDTNHEADSAPERLAQVLQSIDSLKLLPSTMPSSTRDAVAAEVDAFLEQFPNHPFALCEVQAILDFCTSSITDKTLADRVLEHMQPAEEWHVLNAFIRFYMDDKQPEKACDLFELNYATFFDIELDEQMEWQLLMAALQCERHSLAEHLLQTSQSDYAKHVGTIQQWWRRTSMKMGESRVAHMGNVFNRLSSLFNERYPFEDRSEHSDDESTCFLGDDSDWEDSDVDSYCDEDGLLS